MSSLTASTSAALPGPDWLAQRRAAAWEDFAGSELPTTADEIWRYSRIDDLDLDRYSLAEPAQGDPSGTIPPALTERIDQIGARAATVILWDGRLATVELAPELEAKGVAVGPVTDEPAAHEAFGRAFTDKGDALGRLHDAFVADPVMIRVPAGVVVDDPVVVVQWVAGDELAVFPRVLVMAEQESEVTVVQLQGSADVGSLAVPVTEIEVGDAARVRFLSVQETGRRFWQVGHQMSRVGRDATFRTSNVALGGEYARLQIETALVGQGGDAELIAVYFGEGDQVHDFRTKQDHKAPRTRSDLLFKGAVEDRAHSVYSGLIKVRHDAPGTSAFQTNRNVTLSPEAWAESVPNLEIEINDVRCSHASAVGPIDEDQKYYLESRGVPPEMAERLIVLGFFDEVLARMPVPGLRSALRESVVAKFDRRGGGAS